MPALDITNKLMYDKSLKYWLYQHRIEIERWLYKKVNYLDREDIWNLFWQYPHLGKVIAESDSMTNERKYEYVLNFFTKSRITVLTGLRGSGKTAIGMKLGEDLHTRKKLKIYMIQTDMHLPKYFIQTLDPYSVDENSFLIYDEASISLQSRRAMAKENIDISALMAISRHRDFSILFISQHSYLIDTNIYRMADGLFFKRPSIDELEKTGAKERVVDLFTRYIKLMTPTRPEETLFTDGEKWFMFESGLPSFWTDAISRSYKKLAFPSEEAVRFMVESFKEIRDLKRVQRELMIRGVRLELDEIQNIIDRPRASLERYKKAYKKFKEEEDE